MPVLPGHLQQRIAQDMGGGRLLHHQRPLGCGQLLRAERLAQGYRVEVVAEAGLSTPEGLDFGPGVNGWNGDLFVGDEVQKKVLRHDLVRGPNRLGQNHDLALGAELHQRAGTQNLDG